jgi:SynChlorMet cassette radical SAM/SPASM protein ScmE
MPLLWRTPQILELAITNRCNLRCKYCYHFTSPGDVGKDLPKEEWLKFFEELNKCGVMSVSIAGGEPFCREDLQEIITSVVQNKMRFSILTNGTLVTEQMAQFIASTGRCDNTQVSIDGSIPTTHDACRGKGTFKRALEGIQCLRRHKVPVTVRVTIHKDNVNDLEGIAELLLKEIGLPSFSINSAGYMGLCKQNAEQVQLIPQERVMAMRTLLKLDKEYPGRILATAGPLAEGKAWKAMEDARSKGLCRLPHGGYLTGCTGIMKKMGVRADGVMIPCNQLSHIELGRINVDSLQGVWLNHPEMKALRERCQIPLNEFEFCKGCDYINYCTGNCPALAYTLTGKENHPAPDACLKRFLEAGGTLPKSDQTTGCDIYG